MKEYNKSTFFLIFSILFIGFILADENRIGGDRILYPKMAKIPPKIDGILNDPVWQQGPIINDPFIVNNPVYGEVLPQKTEVYISYDPDNIYFAFYCYDNEPDKIKASMTRRDNIFSEDWIDVDLDTMGTRQCTYEHACNAFGIQGDLMNSVSGGETADPDWVWYSAGKIVKDGYIVEIQIPLKSIKFKSGKNVRMNLGIYRNVSRTGTNASWPQVSQKKGYFNSLVPIVFKKLNKQLKLEVLPSGTYGNIWDRESPKNWSNGDDSTEFGVGVKYGITSSVNAELAINPDFSQVESDQFQIVANQRYPIFYSEKRPFFMEIRNQFNLAGTGGDNNMYTAVHTRRIVDPAWGGKLTGELGKTSFGILATGDEWPGREWSDEVNPYLGKNATFMIGRLKYGLKGDDYIGFIYSGREFGEEYNRVVGGDIRFRLKGNHSILFNSLYSFSRDTESVEESKAGSFTLMYDYYQKPLGLQFFLEHVGSDFHMDTAFYRRTGITKFTGYIGPNFYPDEKKLPWLKKINPFIFGYYLHDLTTGMDDIFLLAGVRLYFSMNSWLRLDFRHLRESWAGETYPQTKFLSQGSIQLTKWLTLYSDFTVGQALYYDQENPFLGNRIYFDIETSFQPNDKLRQDLEYTYEGFKNAANGEQVYNLHILVSKTTYQFNKYLFLRALVQYDSYQKVILSDLLASFTLIPGTVIHLGYGSLHQKRFWNNQDLIWQNQAEMSNYYHTRQSIFFKASYRIQF